VLQFSLRSFLRPTGGRFGPQTEHGGCDVSDRTLTPAPHAPNMENAQVVHHFGASHRLGRANSGPADTGTVAP
jgi:hypothetical protein